MKKCYEASHKGQQSTVYDKRLMSYGRGAGLNVVQGKPFPMKVCLFVTGHSHNHAPLWPLTPECLPNFSLLGWKMWPPNSGEFLWTNQPTTQLQLKMCRWCRKWLLVVIFNFWIFELLKTFCARRNFSPKFLVHELLNSWSQWWGTLLLKVIYYITK